MEDPMAAIQEGRTTSSFSAITTTTGATGTLTNSGLTISTQFNGGTLSLEGTKFEWRMSIGTDVLNNNSGGPNGG